MSSESKFSHGYALLVGVGHYKEASLSVPITAQDAQDLGHILTDSQFCAYPEDQVVVLVNENANKVRILAELDAIRDRVQGDSNSTVMIFFSGHGWQEDGYYFLPYETETFGVGGKLKARLNTALANEDFLNKVRQIPAQRLVIVFNTCFAGRVGTALDPETERPSEFAPVPLALYDKLLEGSGIVIISSSKANERSWIRPGARNSLFATHLLSALKGHGMETDDKTIQILADVFGHLSKSVPADAHTMLRQQTPVWKAYDMTSEDFPIALLRGGEELSPDSHAESSMASPPQPDTPAAKIRQMDREQKQDLVIALLACSTMSDRNSRDAVVNELSDDIRNNIRRSQVDRVDVNSIVTTCLDYPNGIKELIEIVRSFERSSVGMQEVDEIIRLAEKMPTSRESASGLEMIGRPGLDLPPDVRSVHHPILEFTNRTDEIRDLTSSYAPPYYLVEAPAGYGKTTLLMEVQRRFREKSWKCAYVSVQDHRSLPSIIRELASELGIPVSNELDVAIQQADANAKTAGEGFGKLVRRHLWPEPHDNGSDACGGLVLLIDIDKSPWRELIPTIDHLLTGFIPGIAQVLHDFKPCRDKDIHSPFRVILAGRYLHRLLSDIPHSLSFERFPLTPFNYEVIRDAARAFLDQEDVEEIVAHLMHYTGGHPGCIARVLDMYKNRGGPPAHQFFTNCADEILDSIVCPEADDVRRNIPPELLGYFDGLCVFRYLNTRVLRSWLSAQEFADFDRQFDDEFELEDALIESGLMAYENYLLRDSITRRLLAIRLMRDKTSRGFAGRCQQAQTICQEYLQESDAQLPHLWAIEVLFQFLQQYAGDIQDAQERERIRGDFFETIVADVIASLAGGRDPKEVSRDLDRALYGDESGSGGDWEFEFAVNYFLRSKQYESSPHETLRQKTEIFFANAE